MQLNAIIEKMHANAFVFEKSYDPLTENEIHWKPGPEKWSLLDIICHLHDEERLDFRLRIEYTLLKSGESWPAIDPEGWIRAHHYEEQNCSEMLKKFLVERFNSLQWLRGLKEADWQQSCMHPQIGLLRAGNLLAAWLAHDYLHLRQIANTKLAFWEQFCAPFSIRYAG